MASDDGFIGKEGIADDEDHQNHDNVQKAVGQRLPDCEEVDEDHEENDLEDEHVHLRYDQVVLQAGFPVRYAEEKHKDRTDDANRHTGHVYAAARGSKQVSYKSGTVFEAIVT